ncbi:conjugal transfer protein [Faecalibacterium sp. An122]|nr:conjugal transfer protein [Faecalibacterium sp. An122]
MPNPHFDITITQRSKGQSAVAGAAYQSGEKLFSEYDQKTKNYSGKRGILYTGIMLPSHAPPEYANRETLWNSVEAAEKQWNAQLARRFVLALPKEVPPEQYPQMVRDYCEKQFVSKGMIADFAIHDPAPPGHNVHCHVMLTLRAMDEHGKWLPKTRKVYDLDENGERIRLPSGNWKSHKEDTVDWNDQKYAEIWRQGWADTVNRYLEAAGREERLDLRSYGRQGLDVIPTVHMGPAVTKMERRGIQTNIGNLNRDIKAANQMLSAIRKTIRGLLDWIEELVQSEKELLKEAASTDLASLLNDYLDKRKAERSEWSWSGQQKGAVRDLKSVSQAVFYLQKNKISTLEQLNAALSDVKQKASQASTGMRKAEKRMKDIAGIQNAVAVCQEHKTVHDKYLKIGWKKRQAAYAESHQEELKAYNKAYRYLKAQHVDLNVNLDALEAEYSKLQADHAVFARQLEQVQAELKPLNEVRYWVGQVVGVKKEAELRSKQSVIGKIYESREETKGRTKEKQNDPKQKERTK